MSVFMLCMFLAFFDVAVTFPAAGNVETGSGCVVMGRTFTLNTNASLEQSQRPCKPRIIEVPKCDGETNTVTDNTMHCSSLGSDSLSGLRVYVWCIINLHKLHAAERGLASFRH